jgi:hypothetical protein
LETDIGKRGGGEIPKIREYKKEGMFEVSGIA